MALDQRELHVAEPSRFTEKFGGNPYFPDVMHHACQALALDSMVRHFEFHGNGGGDFGDATADGRQYKGCAFRALRQLPSLLRAAAVDDVDVFALAVGERAVVVKHIGEAKNGVQRGTQFVAHIGEEQALGPVGRQCCVPGGDQFGLAAFLLGYVVHRDHGPEFFAGFAEHRLSRTERETPGAVGMNDDQRLIPHLLAQEGSPQGNPIGRQRRRAIRFQQVVALGPAFGRQVLLVDAVDLARGTVEEGKPPVAVAGDDTVVDVLQYRLGEGLFLPQFRSAVAARRRLPPGEEWEIWDVVLKVAQPGRVRERSRRPPQAP